VLAGSVEVAHGVHNMVKTAWNDAPPCNP